MGLYFLSLFIQSNKILRADHLLDIPCIGELIVIKIKLKNSGTLQDPQRMTWLARSLREKALLSSWPEHLDPQKLFERAEDIYYSSVKQVTHLLPEVSLVIETGSRDSNRPPHPLGSAKNISPVNYDGWYFELDHYEEDDGDVVSTQHMNHKTGPGPTERHQVDYRHLSNQDMAELLGCNRLLNFKDVPERLRGQVIPSGTDLIEEVQRRLSSRSF